MRFQALQTFWSPELRSMYQAGLFYRVRNPNSPLAEQVPIWLKAGFIKIISEETSLSEIAGIGKVT